MMTATRSLSMTDKIILACVAIFMPLAILVINKLLDRTEIKEKDNTISDLLSKVSTLTAEKTTSAKTESIAKQASSQTAQLAKEQVSSSQRYSAMKSQAQNVSNLDEALELARQQVENTK
jgi:hypothetical protein